MQVVKRTRFSKTLICFFNSLFCLSVFDGQLVSSQVYLYQIDLSFITQLCNKLLTQDILKFFETLRIELVSFPSLFNNILPSLLKVEDQVKETSMIHLFLND